MTRIRSADTNPPFGDCKLATAVVLCRTEQGNLHSGIVYRGNHGPEFMHLGWEDTLLKEWKWSSYLWASPAVEPERLRSIAGLCRQIWRRYNMNKTFPYGFIYHGTTFDVYGKLVLGAGARGLTCATFVLAVFRYFGVELVTEESWPVRKEEDSEFLKYIERFATPTHYDLLKHELSAGCRRIRPEEVLGACSCGKTEALFEDVYPYVKEILSLI